MDDTATSPSARLTVNHCCETSRLERQLLARAYQHVFPEVRRSLADSLIKPPTMSSGLSALQQPPGWRQEDMHVAM